MVGLKRPLVSETNAKVANCQTLPPAQRIKNPYRKDRNLHTAVLRNDKTLMLAILEDSNKNTDTNSGFTSFQKELDQCLLIAVTTKQPEMFESLLKAGADIHAFDQCYPILHSIVDLRSAQMFDIATKFAKDIGVISHHGNLLHSAVRTGEIELVERVYNAGVTNVDNFSPITAQTVLHVAVKQLEMCPKQIKGLEIDKCTGEVHNVPSSTNNCEKDQVGSLEQETLPGNIDINYGVKGKSCKVDSDDYDFKILDFLLSKEFNPNICDKSSDSVLHYAVRLQSRQLCQRLISHGVSKRLLNHRQQTPWMEAIEKEYKDIYDVVSDVEGINDPVYIEKDYCYLQLACQMGHSRMVKYLLEAGANPNVYSKIYTVQSTPVECALWKNHMDCVQHLIDDPSFVVPTGRSSPTISSLFRIIMESAHSEQILEKFCALNVHKHYSSYGPELLIHNCDQLDMVKWLMGHGVSPNEVSPDGAYALERCCFDYEDTFEYLIMNNADVSLTCLDFSEEDMPEPPLVVLLCSGKYSMARLAFAAGFNTDKVCHQFSTTTLQEYADAYEINDVEYSEDVFHLIDMIKEHGRNPRCLQTICRTLIMRRIGCFKTNDKIKKLGLPSHLEDYLSMEGFINMRLKEIDEWIESAKN